MEYLVFDIETIGKTMEDFDEKSLEYFKEWAQRDSKSEDEAMEQIKNGLPFSPFFGEVVTIGMIDQADRGAVYFRADEDKSVKDSEEGGVMYRVGDEKEILTRFWEVAAKYENFITFNGRGFDVPYLMIRSAVHGVRPTVNLLSNRYLGLQRGTRHFDLADLLTFYGALWRKPSLHFVSQAFGVESPKNGGVEGKEVPQAFKDKRYEEIARYCLDDVHATKAVFENWDKYLNFETRY